MHLILPLLTFLGAAVLLTITPGVDTAMVLRTAAAGGPKPAVGAAIGICLGCFVWGLGAAFGLTALLAASQLAFTALKWIGAAYLLWLGLKLLIQPRKAFSTGEGAPPMGVGEAFRRGFLTNMLNPKVGVFYITFLPQFIPAGVSVPLFSILLASIHVMLGLIWFALLIALTVPLGRFLARPGMVGWMDRLTGLVFLGFAVRLAVAERR